MQIAAAKTIELDGNIHLLKIITDENLTTTKTIEIIKHFEKTNFNLSIKTLIKIFTTTNNLELKVAILKAFKKFSDSSTEKFLLAQLDSEHEVIFTYAIAAIGSCGNRESIKHLRSMQQDPGHSKNKTIIQSTIRVIEIRLGIHNPGGLSIAEYEDQDGALSIGEHTPNGGLSIKE